MFLNQLGSRSVSYEPLCSPPETFVYLLYHSERESVGYETSLSDLLNGCHDQGRAPTLIFEFEDCGTFVLWTVSSSIRSTHRLDNVLRALQSFMRDGRQPSTFMLFNSSQERAEKALDGGQCSTLAVLARYDEGLLNGLGLPPELKFSFTRQRRRETTPQPCLHWSKSLTNRKIYYFICAIALALIALVLSINYLATNHTPDKLHVWTQYDTSGSIGPKFQLSVNAQNASLWNSYPAYAGDPSSWTLRIDDQALIPTHLLSPAEAHYQSLLQKRYPEMNQIRLSGSYLNSTWLGSPAIDAVPTDELFHFAHCVLVVKRFVTARDTGRHVCGRDIDREHVQHCLDSLDWWAFPEGRRGEGVPNSNGTFWWRTKVCFD